MMPLDSTKILLPEAEMPNQWYNILPDLPRPLNPPISPATGKPVTLDEISVITPLALIIQEICTDNYIDIPDEILNIYKLWRPSPLIRARRLEEKLGVPTKIYYKHEGISPTGSHKLNTAVAQAYYNKKERVNKVSAETGAGQWGSALSLACNFFDIDLHVYMVRVSFEQKPYRKTMMKIWGADVTPSPSEMTESGRSILDKDRDNPGSIGIAASEAVEEAITNKDVKYSAGSVTNHACLHQTITGLEAKKQMELIDDYPDIIIGCVGGGSNLAGISFPFVRDKVNGRDLKIIAVESAACPSMTMGEFTYDYVDMARLSPILQMFTVGHTFIPSGIHAGGLRFHGLSPIISLLYDEGIIDAVSYHQNECFKAALLFASLEGIIPAPESSHAIKAAIDEALKAKEEGKEKTILFNLSGHGNLDLTAYDLYIDDELKDYNYPKEEIDKALDKLPKIDFED